MSHVQDAVRNRPLSFQCPEDNILSTKHVREKVEVVGRAPGEMHVLVVSDDTELGGLITLNLRQRGFVVEHTDLAIAQAIRWAPSFHVLDLLIVDLENQERVSPMHLRRLARQPWTEGVPLLLATESSVSVVNSLGRIPDIILSRPADVADIVAASRSLLECRGAVTSCWYTFDANRANP